MRRFVTYYLGRTFFWQKENGDWCVVGWSEEVSIAGTSKRTSIEAWGRCSNLHKVKYNRRPNVFSVVKNVIWSS